MATTPITPEDIDALFDLLREMKGRATEAHKANKVQLHSVYVKLVALVSPEVMRLQVRIEREELAEHRKQHKDLRSNHTA